MSKLPTKIAKPGDRASLTNPKTGRKTCFIRTTKKKGFGAWKICKCSESSNPRVPAGSNFLPGVGWY